MRHDVSGMATIEIADSRAFCAVLDAGSITAAAKIVGETKGSVSRRISRLEAALGVALLRRSPRLIQPTEAGARYRKEAGEALELFDRAAVVARGESERPVGRLRITAPIDFAMGLLPGLLARFVDAYPEVRVEMLASDERLDFDAQRLDCALRVGLHRDSSLKVQKLADLEVGVYASPAYLARVGTPRRPADLEALRFVTYANLPRPAKLPFVRAGVETWVSLDPVIVGDGAFVHEVVAQGGGFGSIPRLLAQRSVEQGRLVELLPQHRIRLSAPLSLLYPAGIHVPAKVRVFRDFLQESCALQPGSRARARRV